MKNFKVGQLQIGFVLAIVSIVLSTNGCRKSETPITNSNGQAASTATTPAVEGRQGEAALIAGEGNASGMPAVGRVPALTGEQLTPREPAQSSAGGPFLGFLSLISDVPQDALPNTKLQFRFVDWKDSKGLPYEFNKYVVRFELFLNGIRKFSSDREVTGRLSLQCWTAVITTEEFRTSKITAKLTLVPHKFTTGAFELKIMGFGGTTETVKMSTIKGCV